MTSTKTFLIDGSQAIRLDTIATVTTDELGYAVLVSETGERFNLGRAMAARDALYAVQHFVEKGEANVELPVFLKHTNAFPLDPAYWLAMDSAEAVRAGKRILASLNSQNVVTGLKAFETGVGAQANPVVGVLFKEISQRAMSVADSPEARKAAREIITRMLANANKR